MKKPARFPPRVRAIVWSAFVLLACTALALGLRRGEATVILQKGIRVCLECIGIG